MEGVLRKWKYKRPQVAFSDHVTPEIDSFTNKPVVQCDAWAVKNTFADNSK